MMPIKDNSSLNKRRKAPTTYFPFVGAISKLLIEIKP